jgi:glycosyltransferase involved in cell wall biosynthesis
MVDQLTTGDTEPRAGGDVAIAVVVPCRGHAEQVSACLESLVRQEIAAAYEIILVDSAADPAVATVAAAFPSVRLVRSDAGLSPGLARNLGAAASRAPLLAFIDADCIADPAWLAGALAALERSAGAVGGAVLDALPWHPIAVADNLLQFYDLSPRRRAGPASYFPACNFAIRRSLFDALGGFPSVPLGEDVLLSRAVAREHGLEFVPGMRVRHLGRTGLLAFIRHHRGFGRARGELRLMTRPLEARLAHHWSYLPVLMVKRLAYMGARLAGHSPDRLLRFVVLLPLIALGTAMWAVGMVEGSRRRRSLGDGPNTRAGPPTLPACPRHVPLETPHD